MLIFLTFSMVSRVLFIHCFFKNKFIYLIYLLLASLGLSLLCAGFSLVAARGLLFIAVCGLLIAVASLVVAHGL